MSTAVANGVRNRTRFDSPCPRCKEMLRKGEYYEHIEINGKRRAAHVGCEWTHEAGQKVTQVIGTDPKEIQELQRQIDALKSETTKSLGRIVDDIRGTFVPEIANGVMSRVNVDAARAINSLTVQIEGASKRLDEQVATTMNKAVKKMMAEAKKVQEVKITVARYDGSEFEKQGIVIHPRLEEMLFIARKIDSKPFRRDMLLVGPAGCGKTHAASQMAEMLGLRFGMMSCSASMSEGQILGRLIPVGEQGQFAYVQSDFIDKYENGGVFLFDEVDAADPNALLVLNSALANGKCSVPNRPEKPVANRHPDFVCVLAANTYGRGADRLYCGRNELDEAFLDRFRMGTIEVDYSEQIERHLCPNDELYDLLITWRKRINENRLERVCSTRFIAQAFEDVRDGKSHEYVTDKFFSGWPVDERIKVLGK